MLVLAIPLGGRAGNTRFRSRNTEDDHERWEDKHRGLRLVDACGRLDDEAGYCIKNTLSQVQQ